MRHKDLKIMFYIMSMLIGDNSYPWETLYPYFKYNFCSYYLEFGRQNLDKKARMGDQAFRIVLFQILF